jgi:hypothetical protein
MIGRILLFPFWIVKKVLDLVFGIIRTVGTRGGWVVVGGLVGFFLGKKYLDKKNNTAM